MLYEVITIPVVVVSKDTNLRIKADACGLRAEDYESDRVEIEELYQGYQEVVVEKAWIDSFYAAGESAPPPRAEELLPRITSYNVCYTKLLRFAYAGYGWRGNDAPAAKP